MIQTNAKGYVIALRRLRRALKAARKQYVALTTMDVIDWVDDEIERIHARFPAHDECPENEVK